MRRRVTEAVCTVFLTSTILNGYQPYTEFRPAPCPEIQLNNDTDSAFFIDTKTTVYTKQASRCFLDDLRVKEQLSALYFNASDFRLSTIFQDCLVPTNTECYNPYMRVLRLQPNITYSEVGTLISARLEAAFGHNKWFHIGIRASIPLKQRTISRIDTGSRGPAEQQDLISQAEIQFADSETSTPNARAYRLDFIEALPNNANFDESIKYDAAEGATTIFDTAVSASDGSINGAIIRRKETQVPRGQAVATLYPSIGEESSTVTANLPTAIGLSQENTIYQLAQGESGYAAMLDSAEKSVAQRIKDQDTKATLWLVGTYDTTGVSTDGFFSIDQLLLDKVNQYRENIYEWFHDRNYILKSEQEQGIGDTIIESYIACDLFKAFQIRFKGGLVAPTAREKTTGKNPYAICLGNRGHVECFIGGGMTLLIPHSSLSITTDAQYTTVLSAIEYISATSRGARIKNMGHETTADVSWHSAQGNVWLHITHPKTTNITFSVGYDWYVKTDDVIIFQNQTVPSFLGKTFNTTSRVYDVENLITLNPELAAAHTGAVQHSLCLSTSYTPSPYVTFSAQAGYVLGGRNTPQTIECSIGCTVSL
jgi:hypothetical protein